MSNSYVTPITADKLLRRDTANERRFKVCDLPDVDFTGAILDGAIFDDSCCFPSLFPMIALDDSASRV